MFPIKPKTNNQSRQQRQNEREKKEDKSKEQSTKGYFTLLLLDFNSRRCKLKIIKHTAPDFTKDNKVPPVQSSFYLNTPKMQSGFLEVISDQLRLCAEEHADIPPLTCISLSLSPFHFVSPGERSRRVLRAGKYKPDQWLHQGESDCRKYPKRGPMAMHRHGLNGKRNTKPWHSPMAGALLQTSTICCSSNDNGKEPRQRVMERSFAVWTWRSEGEALMDYESFMNLSSHLRGEAQ